MIAAMIMSRFSSFVVFKVLMLAWCLPAGAHAPIDDVETAIIRKDYVQAKQTAMDLLSQQPSSEQERLDLRYYIGLCELKLGRYGPAKKIFASLIKKKDYPALRDKAYLGLFDVYYINGQYKRALRTAERLLEQSGDSEFLSLIYLKLARVNLKLTHWEQAREHLAKIVKDFPDSLEVHVAKQLLDEEQYFAVQVGAFLERERAEKLALELQNKGEYAYIVETTDQGDRKFYRVRVGQLVQLNKAKKLETKLSREGYPTQIYP